MSLFRTRGRTIRHASWFMSLHIDNCVWNWSGHTQFLSFPLCIWIATRDQMWCFQQFPWQRLHHRISSGTNFLLQSCKSISIKWNFLLSHPRTVCYELGSVQAFLMFSLFKYLSWRPGDPKIHITLRTRLFSPILFPFGLIIKEGSLLCQRRLDRFGMRHLGQYQLGLRNGVRSKGQKKKKKLKEQSWGIF